MEHVDNMSCVKCYCTLFVKTFAINAMREKLNMREKRNVREKRNMREKRK